jgi:hypothetical protein
MPLFEIGEDLGGYAAVDIGLRALVAVGLGLCSLRAWVAHATDARQRDRG